MQNSLSQTVKNDWKENTVFCLYGILYLKLKDSGINLNTLHSIQCFMWKFQLLRRVDWALPAQWRNSSYRIVFESKFILQQFKNVLPFFSIFITVVANNSYFTLILYHYQKYNLFLQCTFAFEVQRICFFAIFRLIFLRNCNPPFKTINYIYKHLPRRKYFAFQMTRKIHHRCQVSKTWNQHL